VLRAFASDRFGDSSVVENVAVKDMIWTFPATSKISGEAHGIEEILARAHTIASYKVKVECSHGLWIQRRLGDPSTPARKTASS